MVSSAPVIIDIVASRSLQDRESVQVQIFDAFAQADTVFKPTQRLWATVGDEFQAVYPDVSTALGATGVAQLLLHGEADIRCGIGYGPTRKIAETQKIEDGEGWYLARDALEEVTAMHSHGSSWLRTWVALPAETSALQKSIRTFLIMRDHVIQRLKAKEKRIVAGSLMGMTQQELARREKISQSAVSQSLRTSGGAALIQAHHTLLGGAA